MRTAPPWARPARAWACDGRVLVVECPPILDLVPMLAAPSVYLVLGTLTGRDDKVWLYRQIMAGAVDDELLARVADALVLSWCGVERWFAARLWEEVLGTWAGFEGPLSARGVDIATVPAARATRMVWSTLTSQHAHDKDKGQAWRRRIEAEPVPVGARRSASAADRSADAASFRTAFAALGGRAR